MKLTCIQKRMWMPRKMGSLSIGRLESVWNISRYAAHDPASQQDSCVSQQASQQASKTVDQADSKSASQ